MNALPNPFIMPAPGEIREIKGLTEAEAGDYAALVDRTDAWIAKVILSQTQTTESYSSRAQAQVHQDVANRLLRRMCGGIRAWTLKRDSH